MKQPFWWKRKSVYNILLSPLGGVYLGASFLRKITTKPFVSDIPVICVGNITSGGAGKTPTAIAIAKILLRMGKKPVFLSRGYGGSLQVPTIVNTDTHLSKQTGDEPLLLSRVAPTIISKNRVLGTKMAHEKGFDVIIMDDGLQNPTITKTISLLVIDGAFGLGSGYIIPAGGLRESLKNALAKTTAVVFIGDDKTNILPKIKDKKIIKAKIKAEISKKTADKYIAFAGLGSPEKFFNTLKENGYNLIDEISFADHYQYKDDDIANLQKLANDKKARLITTQKDMVRLNKNQQNVIDVLPIAIEFENEQEIVRVLELVSFNPVPQ
jgi:tetraacyldisaccharide 4'-kinase